MKAINLYLLTRDVTEDNIPLYENILSARKEEIKYRPEEIGLLRELVNRIYDQVSMNNLDGFFYSFSIPQIGKEFDLLKIGENGTVLNIELKSRMIELDKIEKQLIQNRYYLNNIATEIYSFTLVQDGTNLRLFTYDGKLRECTFEVLITALNEIGQFVEEGIETLFRPKDYLISPLNTPEKFVEGKYYLTRQQEEIKKAVLKSIAQEEGLIWGLTGAAGTGKTLLLYDIAKEQSQYGRTCVIHCGLLSDGHYVLDHAIHNLDVVAAKSVNGKMLENYEFIFVDEAQRIYRRTFDTIINAHLCGEATCVFSYDYTQVLSRTERSRNIPEVLRNRTDFVEKQLTDKIRTNKEVASFIRNMINLNDKAEKRMDYRNIDVIYANNYAEAGEIVTYFCSEKDYKFISYTPSTYNKNPIDYFKNRTNTHRVIGQEFDNVIFSMDNNFRYSEEGRLQGKTHPNPDYIFYKLWYQGVSRAREKLCILVIGNEELFWKILQIKKNG